MTRKSLIQKNKKIFIESAKKKEKKTKIKFKIKKNNSLVEYFKLFSFKKKYLYVKFNNRCYISGRKRSFYRFFSLNRNFIRKIGCFGYIVGLEKSSW